MIELNLQHWSVDRILEVLKRNPKTPSYAALTGAVLTAGALGVLSYFSNTRGPHNHRVIGVVMEEYVQKGDYLFGETGMADSGYPRIYVVCPIRVEYYTTHAGFRTLHTSPPKYEQFAELRSNGLIDQFNCIVIRTNGDDADAGSFFAADFSLLNPSESSIIGDSTFCVVDSSGEEQSWNVAFIDNPNINFGGSPDSVRKDVNRNRYFPDYIDFRY